MKPVSYTHLDVYKRQLNMYLVSVHVSVLEPTRIYLRATLIEATPSTLYGGCGECSGLFDRLLVTICK